jgi:hypothetical protein
MEKSRLNFGRDEELIWGLLFANYKRDLMYAVKELHLPKIFSIFL